MAYPEVSRPDAEHIVCAVCISAVRKFCRPAAIMTPCGAINEILKPELTIADR